MARLNANGTLDTTFNPNVNGTVRCLAMQADGEMIIGGSFTTVSGLPRTNIARLNNGMATQSLIVSSPNRVQWLRGGSSPEARMVVCELSTNGGTSWITLGEATRIAGGWELSGLNLPASGLVRARARLVSGRYNGSAGVAEAVTAYSFPILMDLSLLSDGSFQFGFTNRSGGSFTAFATTNPAIPSSNWTDLGPVTETSPGQFQFTDFSATNFPDRFYQIRSP